MVTLKDVFNPEYNLALKELTERYPNIESSLIEEAAIAERDNPDNQVLQDVELVLSDKIPNKLELLVFLQRVQSEYSNEYMIYGKNIIDEKIVNPRKTESVVQLTLKRPNILFELAKNSYVDIIRKAIALPEGAYLDMKDIPTGMDVFSRLEKQVDTYIEKDKFITLTNL